MLRVEVKHQAQFADVARRLKGAKGTIRRDTTAGLTRSVDKVLRKVRRNVETLGMKGFRVRRAKTRFTAKLTGGRIRRGISRVTEGRVSTSRGNPQLDLVVHSDRLGNARNLPGYFDRQKRFRHPVVGNREVWAGQRSTSGWFRQPILEELPEVRAEVDRQLDKTRRALDGRR